MLFGAFVSLLDDVEEGANVLVDVLESVVGIIVELLIFVHFRLQKT